MAEALIARLGQLAVIVESTKGTKSATAPSASNSKFRVMNLKWTPDVKVFERVYASPSTSRPSHLVGQRLGKLSFSLEFRVTGAAGVADVYGDLLEACGLDEVISAAASTTYTPATDSSTHNTLTMYAYFGSSGAASSSMRVGMRGAMGSVTLGGKIGEPLMLNFEFSGIHDTNDADLQPQADSLDAITHEAAVPPIFQGATLTWGGESVLISSLSIDLGNTVAPRESVGSAEGVLHYTITNRAVTGSIDPELIASGNQLENLNDGTEVALSCSLVHTGARTVVIAAPKCQITGASLGERNGIGTVALNFACNRSAEAGNDELTLTII